MSTGTIPNATVEADAGPAPGHTSEACDARPEGHVDRVRPALDALRG